MEWRGTPPPNAGPPFPVPNTFNGTTGPPFPVPNTSASTQPAPLILQSPSNFQETRLRTSPAPPLRGSKSWTSPLTRTLQPQPAPLSLPSIATGIQNVTNVLRAALDGSPTTPTPYNQVKPTGRQHTERSPNFATNNASPRSTLLPGSASPKQGPPSSQTTPLHKPLPPLPPSAQQGHNGDVVDYSSIDLGRISHNPSLPLADRGSSTAPLRSMSADSATTAVDEQPERALGTTPDQTKSLSTRQTKDTM